MFRLLVAVAAGLSVSACVVQPPPVYWGGPAASFAPVYDRQPEVRAWNTLPAPDVASAVPPASVPGSAPPSSWSARPDTDPLGAGSDSAAVTRGSGATFAEETADYGVPPTNTLHLSDFDAPTPTRIEGAHTITTPQLVGMLASPRPPVLIDVIGGEQTFSLPHAVWLRDAGVGRHLDDDIQAWFDLHLSRLTGDDKSYPLVIFCASRRCWLAHNATLRALDLGYTNVSWYRGGRDAWHAAGLPLAPVAPTNVDD